MVNTGKPSGGCKLCRARRIKCDETKPACLKCLRAKRQCPGYRDPFEGKIRDETQATIRKFKRTRIVIEKEQVLREESLRDDSGEVDDGTSPDEEDGTSEDARTDVIQWDSACFDGRRRSTPPHSASSGSFSTSSSFETIHEDFWKSISTPVEQQATCYLLADYVLVSDTPSGRRGYFKFAYKILTKPEGPSKCLRSAFKAVSIVALSSRPGASHLVIEAESHYAKALREVNKAIQDPAQVKHDDTLAAVLLLAFYETLASRRERLDEYVSHIKGAAQLVKVRGPEQNDTEEGSEMFSMTRNQFLAIRSLAPAVDGEDYSWLLHQSCPDAYVSRVATLSITCSEIRMKVDRALTRGKRDPRKIQAVLDLLRGAQAMSKKLSALDQPQSAVWTVVKTGDNNHNNNNNVAAGVQQPPGEVYNFHNLYTCMIYTIIWTSHLFLTTCIFRCMAWLVAPDDWRAGDDYELVVEAARRRVGDIVAAMPYACSWNGYNSDYADFVCGTTSPNSPAKGVAGMCVYKPAFTAMMCDYATPEQKEYLYGRLKFLADEVGIKQVNVLLKLQDQSAHPSQDIERDKIR